MVREPAIFLTASLVIPPLVATVVVGRFDSLALATLFSAIAVGLQLGLVWGARRWRALSHRNVVLAQLLVATGLTALLIHIVVPASYTLFLPVVALAGAVGRREAAILASASTALYLVPVLVAPNGTSAGVAERAVIGAGASILVAAGARYVTSEREKAARALRRSVRLEQRRARQLSGIEEVGRHLAVGPTREALEHVVDVLRRQFGYRYVSVYLDRGDGTYELGAQRGYETMIDTFDGSYGIVGRVIRTGQAELVVDVSTDPDYVSANPDVVSEVCAPLLDGASVLGIVNVESARGPLDGGDRRAVVAIADRLAAYVALGRERRRLADLSARDPLTGLLNRRSLEERVTNVFSERASADPAVRRPLALVLFDLDHFGRLNKDHGHALGDEVLRQFGALLARQFRASDVVARYGGEEFVAILDGAGLEEAAARADCVREALAAASFEVSSGALQVTVSAGCAELPAAQVGSWSDLMATADVALGMAKRAGRNQLVSASV